MKFNEIEQGGVYQRGDEKREVTHLNRNMRAVKYKRVGSDTEHKSTLRAFAGWAQSKVEEPAVKMDRDVDNTPDEEPKLIGRESVGITRDEPDPSYVDNPVSTDPNETDKFMLTPEQVKANEEGRDEEPEDVPIGTPCEQLCVCKDQIILIDQGDAPICSDCEDPKHRFEINGLSFACKYVGEDSKNGHCVQLTDGLPHLARERLTDVKCYGETYHDAVSQMEAHVGQIVIDIQREMRKEARKLARKEARQNPN